MPSPNVKPTAIRFWPDMKAPIQAIADEHGFTFHAVVLHLVKVGLGSKVDWKASGLRIVGTKLARAEKVKAEKPVKAPRTPKAKAEPKAKTPPAEPKIDSTRYTEWMKGQPK